MTRARMSEKEVAATLGVAVLGLASIALLAFGFVLPRHTIDLSNDLMLQVIDSGMSTLDERQIERLNTSRKYSYFLNHELKEKVDMSIGSLNDAYDRWQEIKSEVTPGDSRNYKPVLVNGIVFIVAEDCDILSLRAEDFPCDSEFNRYAKLIMTKDSLLPQIPIIAQ